MISRSFLSSSIVFTVGGALPMLAGIILLPFYTDYLSDEQYTQLLFYISVSLLFQILFSFSTETYFGVQFTRLSDNPEKQKAFMGSVALLLLMIGGVLLLVMSLAGNLLFKLVYNDSVDVSFWPYGFYSVLTGFFNSYFKTATVGLIYLKKPRLFFGLNMVNFFFTVGISVIGLQLYPYSVAVPVYGRLISGAVIFVMAHFVFGKFGRFTYLKEFTADLVKFCFPYVLFVISMWVLGQADRYFMQSVNKSDLNAYDLMLKCFFGIEFLQNSLSAVIFPKLYEIWNKNGDNKTTPESNRYFNVFNVVNIVQLILFCVFIPLIYRLFINKDSFYVSENYIGILAAGYVTRGILNYYVSTVLFIKRTGLLLKIFGLSAVLQIAITTQMVKSYGINGAIYAGLIVKCLQVVFCIVFTKGFFEYRFNPVKIFFIPVLFFVINVLQYFFFPSYNVVLYLLQLLVFTLLFYFVFRNEILLTIASFTPNEKKRKD